MEEKKAWYVINTYAGHERNVKDYLEQKIKNEGLQDLIFRIEIAEEEETDIKNNKVVKKIRNLFPGYIFAEMIMTDEIWYTVRNTQGVTGFIGSSGGGAKPFSVPDEEMETILRRIGKLGEVINVTFKVGDRVKIVGGALNNCEGVIESMDDSTKTAKILVYMLGRETQIEVDYVDLEPVE